MAHPGSDAAPRPPVELDVEVEVEEDAYHWLPADNGAGPLWCYGSTCLVRHRQDVFMSGLETIPNVRPLHNVRWLLLRRTAAGRPDAPRVTPEGDVCAPWELVRRDTVGRTREPCPLALFGQRGEILLSANPTLAAPDAYSGPARPELVVFRTDRPDNPPVALQPAWNGAPPFTEHSYRGLAADGNRGELLLLNVQSHEAQHWSFLDRHGEFSAHGRLDFPEGDYEEPQRIRLCYPNVAVRDRAAHVLAISDIVEPVRAWRDYKFRLTGQKWDYDFRRLFYTWTPDVTSVPFRPWQEIDSREATAGSIRNLDLWIGPDGAAHLLWWVQSLDPRLKQRFFPEEGLSWSIQYAVVRAGRIELRARLAEAREGGGQGAPGWARLHATPSGRLFAFVHWGGDGISENRLFELYEDGTPGPATHVRLREPLTNFMTATERGGSPPSPWLDLMGTGTRPGTMRYARVRVR